MHVLENKKLQLTILPVYKLTSSNKVPCIPPTDSHVHTIHFYENDRLSLILDQPPRRIKRISNFALAEINAFQQALLLTQDVQASVLSLTGKHTNSKQIYSPYGHCFHSAICRATLAFTGEFLDTDTNTYPLGNGHRAYAPLLMRFLSPDSMSPFLKGGINSYAYCGNDPINSADPTGRTHGKIFKNRYNNTNLRQLPKRELLKRLYTQRETRKTIFKQLKGAYPPIKKILDHLPDHEMAYTPAFETRANQVAKSADTAASLVKMFMKTGQANAKPLLGLNPADENTVMAVELRLQPPAETLNILQRRSAGLRAGMPASYFEDDMRVLYPG
ncbi:RHS repeat-associated core domain-containing protein [Pseudomonas asiatica]|nr:RHS repeat-associated core domain-containing protein [Pseudomonas asiatica]